MASLSGLSNELKLIIIEVLDAEELKLPEQDPNDDSYREEIEDDPPRKLPMVNTNLVNLSCVDRLFRTIVAPYVFKTVILRNNETSARSVQTLSNGPYASLIKRLEYLAVAPFPSDFEDQKETFEPKAEHYPAEVEDILAHLDRFEKLETVGIEFPWGDGSSHDAFYNFEDAEVAEVIANAEEELGWRALMQKSYNALTRNRAGVVKKLELRNLVPREASVWRTDAWRKFLGGLEGFEISLRGGENGAGWCINTLDGYIGFVGDFHDLFFNHLGQVRDFKLFATHYGPVGMDTFRVAPLHLSATQMPHLTHLTLNYVILSKEIVDFIASRAATLQAVRFHNVYVTRLYDIPDGEVKAWAQLFNALLRADPKQLREFDLVWGKYFGGVGLSDDTWNPEWKLVYVHMDDKYGMLFIEGDGDVDGQDQMADMDMKAYQKLLQMVERNREIQ